MAQHKIAYITAGDTDVTLVERGLAGLDYEMNVQVCNSHGETIEAVKGVDVIIDKGVSMPREVVEGIDTAVAIVSMGHGFDRIDHNAATDQGVMVVNTAGFVTEEVANHTIMLLLACAKKLTIVHELVRAGKWDVETHARFGSLPPIDGQVLGLVGLGNIGRATALRARVFGMEVLAYDPYVAPWDAKEYRVEVVQTLNELASRSDFVSMHTPLNDETSKLAGEAFFRAMKPTAYFINTTRGGTVDERALVRALQNSEIAGAGIDVFEQEPTPHDNPLLALDNVIVSPHSAGLSDLSTNKGKLILGQEAARILRGTWPMSLVNPEVRAKIPMRPADVNG
jgi:D-3-phosphoglycerate dehydrogenase